MSALAGQVISENETNRATSIDLGRCGLKKIPPALFNCDWIEILVLSNEWWDSDRKEWIKSKNDGPPNRIVSIPEGLTRLRKLKTLIMGNENILHRPQIYGLGYLRYFSRLEVLDLSFNRIYSAEKLLGLLSLKKLNLSGTAIKNFGLLVRNRQLRELNLSYNKVSGLGYLKDLKKLKALSLDHCRINRINFLRDFKTLKTLSLNSSHLAGLDFIKGLTQLNELEISQNEIVDFGVLGKLINLKKLNISGNEINDLSFLNNLNALRGLEMFCSRVPEFVWIGSLKNLTHLDLSGTLAEDYTVIGKLKKLNSLKLAFNQISEIGFLSKLKLLAHLDLSYNSLIEIKSLFPLANFSYDLQINLSYNNVLNKIPIEVLKVGWPGIKDRIAALQKNDEFVPINEVKLLILGNPNVGKSNLLEFFETGCEPQKKIPTHGIQYKVIKKVLDDININCWDFGGDDYFHATHQLFFSPGAINIIIWSNVDVARDRNTSFYTLNYWLRNLDRIISKNFAIPQKNDVIICENKLDLQNFKPSLINQNQFIDVFPQLELWFSYINLKPLKYVDSLKELLGIRASTNINLYQKKYSNYLQLIRGSKADFLLVSEIRAEDNTECQIAMKIFHNMGIVLYFHDILPDKIFIKPQRLLAFLYRKILSADLLRLGRFSVTNDELEKSIYGNSLKLQTNEVIDLMVHFDLVFQIQQERKRYFFPQYMRPPNAEIERLIEIAYSSANILITSDIYLLNIIMLKIYKEYGTYVVKLENRSYSFWKDAIAIEKDKQQILIQLNRSENTIQLRPSSKGDNIKLQNSLVNFIVNAYRNSDDNDLITDWRLEYPSNEHDELFKQSIWYKIFVSNSNNFVVNWDDLMENILLNGEKVMGYPTIADYYSKTNKKLVEVTSYKTFIHPQLLKKMKKSVFVCYSHENIKDKQNLQKFLNNLITDGLIDLWEDGQIDAGDDWDQKIKNKLETADICILLVSQDLITSKYVNDVEFKRILERQMNKDCRVIPVILKPCDWKYWRVYPDDIIRNLENFDEKQFSIKTFQFLPLNTKRQMQPISDWKSKEQAWLQVVDAVRRFCN